MRITVLPDLVSSQIAAGEVVERPASVVKELIENSIDAQATNISIRIEGAGKTLISIADNGKGIPDDELKLAVARHATSKLRTIEDLAHINTLGFRGEALASIGSVSNLQISSRVASSQTGTRLTCAAGKHGSTEKVASTVGTTVVVENLFFNLPARQKFLKQDKTEMSLINDIVYRYAAEYSLAQFRYVVDGKEMFVTPGNGDMNDGLIHLFGFENLKSMIFIQYLDHPFAVKGYISPISLTKSNRKGITFFVNGRWIQDSGLVSTFLQAYRSFLMVGRFPFCFLTITIPPENVDVNVHPAKAQIKMMNSDQLLGFIHREVKKGISESSPIPRISLPHWKSVDHENNEFRNKQFQFTLENRKFDTLIHSPLQTPSNFEQGSLYRMPLLRPIGQIGLVYIVAEGPDGLYLIDQHAAHERILFDKYLKSNQQSFPGQTLMETAVVDLPVEKAELIQNNLERLSSFGFLIEDFGNRSFIIRAVPQIFQDKDPKDLLLTILDETDDESNYLELSSEQRFVARICKKLAIKGGQLLSLEEQRNLLEDLENCESPQTCPHGRKVMIHLSTDMLERQFGRKGSI